MFMDESAFELDDLEKDLAAAGLEPDERQQPYRGNSYTATLAQPKESEIQARPTSSAGRHARSVGGSSRSGRSLAQPPAPATPPPSSALQHVSHDSYGAEHKLDLDTAGGINQSQSRARVLAQQRGIQLKKRQQSMGAGAVRSNCDLPVRGASPLSTAVLSVPRFDEQEQEQQNSSTASGGTSPAVKQFSAPRQVEDDHHSSNSSSRKREHRSRKESEFDYKERAKDRSRTVLDSSDHAQHAQQEGKIDDGDVPKQRSESRRHNNTHTHSGSSSSRRTSDSDGWEVAGRGGQSLATSNGYSGSNGGSSSGRTIQLHASATATAAAAAPDDSSSSSRRQKSGGSHDVQSRAYHRDTHSESKDQYGEHRSEDYRGDSTKGSRSNNASSGANQDEQPQQQQQSRSSKHADSKEEEYSDHRNAGSSARSGYSSSSRQQQQHPDPSGDAYARQTTATTSSNTNAGNSSNTYHTKSGYTMTGAENSWSNSGGQNNSGGLLSAAGMAMGMGLALDSNLGGTEPLHLPDDPFFNNPHLKPANSNFNNNLNKTGSQGHMAAGQQEDNGFATQSTHMARERERASVSSSGFSMSNYMLDMSDMREFLTTPVPRAAGIVQCYIRRNKSGTNKLFPEYHVYMMEGDRFLMCSKKRPNNKTSNYLISMKAGDMNRGSRNYLGKLRANFVGTEFQVFDSGANPRDVEPAGAHSTHNSFAHSDKSRQELGVVMYASNVLGSRGPRKMQVAIPKIDSNGHMVPSTPTRPEDDMMFKMKNHDFEKLCYLINKPPRWNDQVAAYVLNFNGRVTMASVKNFQLVTPEDQESVVLQFGRVAKDEFTMDYAWPMTAFQAFAIVLSSFDSKIACD